ncbi:tetratricopeptide repeat-containing sensor histidine kinase [Mucilaginibacter gotjawali]|uniref:Signal transduction histidine kinase/tetratricopeptide (TPR) repeat protein n=2 Tax=Mucilaginibacter gotjawali TaxID=1550579 RepID=A0A839SPX4_9SPHI|nr:tetratricopeptide repeat-containing sensor histidine kinase [Mucilaginibacter gotjawali]MBB3058427.1 signal transduction histidine kinase/tetratricopeptide (TPR) repeat protein [Mucilaginibacter gotjawali]BAU53745.1 Non-motile and phage-resistance protein [Mucilaginibacter gotjawali]
MRYTWYLCLLLIVASLIKCNKPGTGIAVKNQSGISAATVAFEGRLYQQNKPDSLIIVSKNELAAASRQHKKKAMLYFSSWVGVGFQLRQQIDSAIYYCRKAEMLAFETKNEAGLVSNQIKLAGLYYDSGKPDSVNIYKDKMTIEADTMKNIALKNQLIAKLGDVFATTNQPEKALNAYFQTLRYYQEKKDTLGMGLEMMEIAMMYNQLSKFDKAVEYAVKATQYVKSNWNNSIVNYRNLGGYYYSSKQYDQSLGAFEKGISLARQFKDTANLQAIYISVSSTLIVLKEYKKAGDYLTAAFDYYGKKKNEVGFYNTLVQLGSLKSANQQFGAAINYYQQALELALKSGHLDSEANIYYYLADAAGKAGNYQKAYIYELKYDSLKYSMAQTTTAKTITDLEIKYQSDQKEHRIALLKEAGKLKDVELTDEKRKWWFLLAIIGFLSVIAFLLYRSYTEKKTSHKLLEEKNEALNLLNEKLNEANSSKTKLFSILSHDLRAPVNSLFQFLNIQKNHAGKLTEIQAQKHNQRIINSAENLMESMEDLLIWSKSQMNSFSLNLSPISALDLITLTATMYRDFAEERKLTIDINCETDVILTTDVNFLKIVLRNILSNAIKFTPAGGHIKITALPDDDFVRFSITDDGPGLTHEQIENLFEWNSIRSDSSGLGLKLAKEFTIRLNGAIKIDSSLQNGSTFTVLVPIRQNVVS